MSSCGGHIFLFSIDFTIFSGTRLHKQLIVECLKYMNTCIFDNIVKEKDEEDNVQTDHANAAKVCDTFYVVGIAPPLLKRCWRK